MELDDDVCLCFHVSKRKVVNFIRNENPSAASQVSQCFGAGTGCGWCRPYLEKLYRQLQGDVLSDEDEHVMVRHEAAEALGAIGDYSVIPILEKFVNHPMPEISESCEVAIDLLDWCKSKEYHEVDC